MGMATGVDLKNKFKTAVQGHSNLRTFIDGYAYEVNDDVRAQMPLFIYEPPSEGAVDDYRSKPFIDYTLSVWVLDQMKINDKRDRFAVWESMEAYLYDIVDSVIDRSVLPVNYNLVSGLSISYFPDVGNDKLIGIRAGMKIRVFDCRNSG